VDGTNKQAKTRQSKAPSGWHLLKNKPTRALRTITRGTYSTVLVLFNCCCWLMHLWLSPPTPAHRHEHESDSHMHESRSRYVITSRSYSACLRRARL